MSGEKKSGGRRARSGRKAVNIDMEQLEKLCGLQCTDAEVAAFLGISVRTLDRRKATPASECCRKAIASPVATKPDGREAEGSLPRRRGGF